jgi:hypothetical protein
MPFFAGLDRKMRLRCRVLQGREGQAESAQRAKLNFAKRTQFDPLGDGERAKNKFDKSKPILSF